MHPDLREDAVGLSVNCPAAAARYGGNALDLCAPTTAGRRLTYANDAVENTSGDTITIEKVSLVGAHDARAVDAYLAPIVDQTLIGTMSDWPAVEQASTAQRAGPELDLAEPQAHLLTAGRSPLVTRPPA